MLGGKLVKHNGNNPVYLWEHSVQGGLRIGWSRARLRNGIALTSASLLAVTAMPALAAKPATYTDDKNGTCPKGYTLTDASVYPNANLDGDGDICVK